MQYRETVRMHAMVCQTRAEALRTHGDRGTLGQRDMLYALAAAEEDTAKALLASLEDPDND